MVDVAEIYIWNHFVGAVRWDAKEGLGSFQYAPEFLALNYDLSPIKMPISQGAVVHRFPSLRQPRNHTLDTFKGLPGLLADSLPDHYGNRLINTWLAKQGRPENSMNPVEKLCFIGSRGMGALTFQPAQINSGVYSRSVEVDSLVSLAKRMLNKRESFLTQLDKKDEKAMMDLLKIGTSAGGARPKAVIAFNAKTGEVRSGQGRVPKGFEHYLIKLDGVHGAQFGESAGWGRVEYAYYLMAKDCGITIEESRLLEENGRAHFLTKRFDRERNVRHHIQSLCGIQHYDFNDMDSYSYEQVFQTMRLLRLSYPEAEEMFRRMVFNVVATNFDDHTKNISFRLKQDDRWCLAPAYDLCFSYHPDNHWVSRQTLSVNGKRLGITLADLLTVAKANNIKRPKQIIDRVNEVVSGWKYYADRAAVRSDLRKRIGNNLNLLTKN